jgi:diguanylate cyclase
METAPSAQANRTGPQSVAQLAKATLHRLALEKLEPTPENYARAYAQEKGGARPSWLPEPALLLVRRLADRALGGEPARAGNVVQALSEGQWERAHAVMNSGDDGAQQLAMLIERLVRGLGRGGRIWTTARKKDGLQRVLEGSRSDVHRLKQRLGQLMASWEADSPDATLEAAGPNETGSVAPVASAPAPVAGPAPKVEPKPEPNPGAAPVRAVQANSADPLVWTSVLNDLCATLNSALPADDADSARMKQSLAELASRFAAEGATPALVAELAPLCRNAQLALQHRHHLVDQLGALCRELTASMTDLAENDSWARGQCEAMHNTLNDGISARGVKAVNELLRNTRKRQGELRREREQARDTLKTLISNMLGELNELGSKTGRFQDNVGRLTDVIEQADTLDSLTLVVREMVDESRAVHSQVAQSQARLNEEHAKALGLSQRVNELEGELRRLAEEVTTDQLTQVANRRGLLKVFDVERARMERGGSPLSIGLLDIDNFKRLNDEHGHQTGDDALKALAALISKTLRATDLVARYGGEEFVVLLPETALQDAQDTLSRLQRSLSGGLFLNGRKDLLVTFSAGVTVCRNGERIESVLERADQALYEAKRTGKNRTCVA